ncbi:MAG: Acetylornithine aminotransferase [uncultured Thermomicrobiales bacterium]|uniref:Acetylornithine aminotransferase n=1 Tax=uncultured Thermomicrobiales bacterium TaxID=1645740 RepID=A0A6J4VKD8_9BACT|nr:MAG: Acetylornithine aminotransferase [uncultured Thermomicrobiales bacterium]
MASTASSATIAERDARFIASAIKIRYTPFVLAGGDGAWLVDADGRRFLDFGAGWSVAHLGYSNRHVRQAVVAQLERTTYAGLNSTVNLPAVDLAEKLVSLIPGDGPKKAWFGLSGSDANEAALRLILRATGRRRVLSFVGSWHGTTEATMGLSGHTAFTAAPGGGHITKLPYPDPYRNPFGARFGSDQVVDQCLDYVEGYLFKTVCPPEDVAAVFVEAVQADSGDVVPPPDFMPKLRALCDRHGILLVADEVKTGLGRTGRMFAVEHTETAADVVLLGKSLGGGLPLSAVVAPPEILDCGSGIALFTVSGNATSCAAGLATLEVVEGESLVDLSARNGDYLRGRLAEVLGKHEPVGDVRGLGMMIGVDLVRDRVTKEPDQRLAAKVVYRAWELGLILFYAGSWGNVLEITPPLILTREEIDHGVDLLDRAIADALAGKVSDEAVAPFAGW